MYFKTSSIFFELGIGFPYKLFYWVRV